MVQPSPRDRGCHDQSRARRARGADEGVVVLTLDPFKDAFLAHKNVRFDQA